MWKMTKIQKMMVCALPLFLMTGCLQTLPFQRQQSAEFANQHSVRYERLDDESLNKIIDDAVAVLLKQYPPATTRFDVKSVSAPEDKFGKEFYSRLLMKGFAISEVDLAKSSNSNVFLKDDSVQIYKLRYVVDSVDLSYMTLVIHVDENSFSRSYSLMDGKWSPASAWSKRS